MPPASFRQPPEQHSARLRKRVPAKCLMFELPVLPWKNLQIFNADISAQCRPTDARAPLRWSFLPAQRERLANGVASARTRQSQRTLRRAYCNAGSGTTRSSAQPIMITDGPAVEGLVSLLDHFPRA